MTEEKLSKRSCPKCEATESIQVLAAKDYTFAVGNDYYLSKCIRCGLLYQNPAIASKDLLAHYPEDYKPYNRASDMTLGNSVISHAVHKLGYKHVALGNSKAKVGRNLLRSFYGVWRSRIDLVPTFVDDGSILELGCADGRYLSLMQNLGWRHLTGIEISAYAASLARNRGIRVLEGDVNVTINEIPDESQDVIVASMLLEHVERPFELLQVITKKLKPGGQLLVSTVHRRALDYFIFEKFWYHLDLPRHFTIFCGRDLRDALDESYRNIGLYIGSDPKDYHRSLQIKKKEGENLNLLDKLLMRVCRLALFRGFVMITGMLGLGARITVFARKK